ncbi:MAG TPA: UDP-N-acetylmuramate--L-alanine ligase [Flavobacteriales bacterium]|nr:UDP-N-acetylmuramate--L-alanine ligase [Flavobacteriales bacterium]QQS74080.1 MAG: UDP-N-acetylmuramate--L-alanine ligase [Flavobacteriales bacterium]HQV38596.1 UDP-N-acetylmuramate--L-alanine ligase [Flavobacteriales bacterium]HQW32557.1 UDP-N-acetylmuramate--L-alanine ligase [Flavobacteriales bacterium]HQY03141.1 UDP-N-acetylmuramate--L-alanine ligase [Flavobacteriales bacterium]
MERPEFLYFIGIGGIGMSGLARYFRRQGARVAGYDKTPSELAGQLSLEGIDVSYDPDPRHIPQDFRDASPTKVMVVRTPAVPMSNPLIAYWQGRGVAVKKRSEVLGLVTKDRRTMAVAGTHGKTTVSTMLAHLLTAGGVPCNAFLGGISVNYDTNVLLNSKAELNVVEADEYDRSFLALHPNEAIVTAMDPDHLDIYGTPEAMYAAYADFAALVTGRMLVHRSVLPRLQQHATVLRDALPYGIDGTEGPHAENVEVRDGAYHFDLVAAGHVLRDLTLGMPGRHNVENAVAAATMALHAGVSPEALRKGLVGFKGVRRRFEVRARTGKSIYIDDYAHHPTELDACIRSVKELYPDRKVTGIFQPHLFSRTRDLAADFASSLAQLDELILLEIYPAREEAIPGITSQWLLDQVKLTNKMVCTKEQLMPLLDGRNVDILLTLGAGDIDRLVPGVAAMVNSYE